MNHAFIFYRVYTIPRTATPVPPSGLNYTDLPEDFDMMQHQEDKPMLGLANAPPLFQETNDILDIGPNGEKRKATPPDLLTLSNMYFERNQVFSPKIQDRSESYKLLFHRKSYELRTQTVTGQ